MVLRECINKYSIKKSKRYIFFVFIVIKYYYELIYVTKLNGERLGTAFIITIYIIEDHSLADCSSSWLTRSNIRTHKYLSWWEECSITHPCIHVPCIKTQHCAVHTSSKYFEVILYL